VNPIQHILIFAVRLYRWTLSPALTLLFGSAGCRFQPTCSAYALEALQTHGALAGSWLAARRVCRCHPWGGGGHDPVPGNAESGKRKAENPVVPATCC
jgi:putative membrane protein insertion efficiency factor